MGHIIFHIFDISVAYGHDNVTMSSVGCGGALHCPEIRGETIV